MMAVLPLTIALQMVVLFDVTLDVVPFMCVSGYVLSIRIYCSHSYQKDRFCEREHFVFSEGQRHPRPSFSGASSLTRSPHTSVNHFLMS